MNNFSVFDLIFIGFIIYAIYQGLTKGAKKGTQRRSGTKEQVTQENPDLMAFFKSAVDEIKQQAASQQTQETREVDSFPDEADDILQPERVYTERMTEPAALISEHRKRQSPPEKKPEFRDESEIKPSFEYLKPGELVISDDDKTDIPPIHEKLFESLGDPHNLQHAILLREVLDPPVSKRKKHPNGINRL